MKFQEESLLSITFLPLGRTISVLEGTRLLEAVSEIGLGIDQPCGGEGTCGKCRLRMVEGACEPTLADETAFSPEEIQEGWRLACQAVVTGPAVVEIPESSLIDFRGVVLTESEDGTPRVADPAIEKRVFTLPPLALEPENRADELGLLRDLLPSVEIEGAVLADWRRLAEKKTSEMTAVAFDGRLITLETGNTEASRFAVAVDLGTSTLAAVLVDLSTGARRAVASQWNAQAAFGDDVLSRIRFARDQVDGLDRLHEAVVKSINRMIVELAEEAGVAPESIYELTVSGNTTMQHLFCRFDTRGLGEIPFRPITTERVLLRAADLKLGIHPRGMVYVMPSIGGFVGGDIVSGILVTCGNRPTGPTLLADIGTNGELALFHEGKWIATSTAAGPAFEGARISCGMQGAAGAIEKVLLREDDLHFNLIGQGRPRGLCGSGLVDLTAELLRCGILRSDGRLLSGDELPVDLPDALRRRVVVEKGQPAVELFDGAQTDDGRPIRVSGRDFRELQLASGAIRAGLTFLLRRAGLEPTDLEHLYLGGGFGNFIRRSNAQRIGLLPPEIARQRILYQGNTSLAGARMVALSRTCRASAERIARETGHVDFSRDPAFQEVYVASMGFPE